MITRRRKHLVLALLLPLLALRTFLPSGYMVAPTAADGGWQLVMCSQGLLAATDDGADHGATGDQHLPQDSGQCPFAMAGAAVLPVTTTWSFAITAATLHFIPAALEQLPPATGPPRQTAARAPPTLST